MKRHISKQNTLLALSVIFVFTISGCLFKNGRDRDGATKPVTQQNALHTSAQVAIVK